jgi:hypothetical protein
MSQLRKLDCGWDKRSPCKEARADRPSFRHFSHVPSRMGAAGTAAVRCPALWQSRLTRPSGLTGTSDARAGGAARMTRLSYPSGRQTRREGKQAAWAGARARRSRPRAPVVPVARELPPPARPKHTASVLSADRPLAGPSGAARQGLPAVGWGRGSPPSPSVGPPLSAVAWGLARVAAPPGSWHNGGQRYDGAKLPAASPEKG